ncbi:hypothetical protein QGN23_13570 [Chryseobacterium gotjawalense]|uniref:SGNH/GDSL hydrolase family protein n=1 Tax=Chryseobacterium gotjawalense TaxID=3042315 RepID=A0ABY8RC53_9FLAO|nr:hypothetical protein [Chryseobacterium sp. wdc7]WHF51436.1 hypothetical protein QGN23_13570 [Chryseobacterium sp. wdc7]
MKLFFKRLGIFMVIIICFVTGMIISTKYFDLAHFPFKQESVHVLILGDSHTQCGIDDALLPHSLNLSESADTYFYSYVKLKRMFKANPQIDTLILGYADFNITDNQDRWLRSENINSFKLPIYFFLFDQDDFSDFIKINPTQLLEFSGTIFKRNFSHLYRIFAKEKINKFGIGGFLALEKQMENKEKSVNNKNINTTWKQSEIDILYLKKINDLCTTKNVKLILIATPTQNHSISGQNSKQVAFRNSHLKEAAYIDFSGYPLKNDNFADNSHLNAKGAAHFTVALKRVIINHNKQVIQR